MLERVVLLQGPLGSFFKTLKRIIEDKGFRAWQFAFNGGDWFFGDKDVVSYKGDIESWRARFKEFCNEKAITCCIVYGETRIYHEIAKSVCDELGIKVLVFEEGYVRPSFVTGELGGVNGYSSLIGQDLLGDLVQTNTLDHPCNSKTFLRRACYASAYYIARALGCSVFEEKCAHHRSGAIREGRAWLSGFKVKIGNLRKDAKIMNGWLPRHSGKVFLVPLQVHNDSQVIAHSKFNDVPSFLREVFASFAENSCNDKLLIKHHPMDRGYACYRQLINELVRCHGLYGRVVYGSEFHLPSVYKHLKGCVVINSTVGLSALHHGVPTICLGKSIYNVDKVTYRGKLAEFWTEPGMVDLSQIKVLEATIKKCSQYYGSFYKNRKVLAKQIVEHLS